MLTIERRNEIAYQVQLLHVRKNLSLRDIADAKRIIGNLAKEPEMAEANITKDELLEFGKLTVREVFEKQMARL